MTNNCRLLFCKMTAHIHLLHRKETSFSILEDKSSSPDGRKDSDSIQGKEEEVKELPLMS